MSSVIKKDENENACDFVSATKTISRVCEEYDTVYQDSDTEDKV